MQKFAYNTFGLLRRLGQRQTIAMAQHENDPPKRVICLLAPASILVLMMSFLVFPGFVQEGVRLTTFGRTTAACSGARSAAARSTAARSAAAAASGAAP